MKMKVFMLMLMPFLVTAQKPITFEGVLNVDTSVSQNAMFKRVRGYLVESFRDYNKVKMIEDEQEGVIVIKCIMHSWQMENGFGRGVGDTYNVYCTMRMRAKKGSVKYLFDTFVCDKLGEITDALPKKDIYLTQKYYKKVVATLNDKMPSFVKGLQISCDKEAF
jgi:hypothetical protein